MNQNIKLILLTFWLGIAFTVSTFIVETWLYYFGTLEQLQYWFSTFHINTPTLYIMWPTLIGYICLLIGTIMLTYFYSRPLLPNDAKVRL